MVNDINFVELVRLSFAKLGYTNPSEIDMTTPLWMDGFDEEVISNLFFQIEADGKFDFSGDFHHEFSTTVTPDFTLMRIANTLKNMFDKYPEKDINPKTSRKPKFGRKINANKKFKKAVNNKKQMILGSQLSQER